MHVHIRLHIVSNPYGTWSTVLSSGNVLKTRSVQQRSSVSNNFETPLSLVSHIPRDGPARLVSDVERFFSHYKSDSMNYFITFLRTVYFRNFRHASTQSINSITKHSVETVYLLLGYKPYSLPILRTSLVCAVIMYLTSR